jgi:phosphonoacetate hydrolase
MERAGVRTLCVTAKDKLRALLGSSRDGGPAPVSLSAEKAHEQTVDGVPVVELVGRKNPSIYEWDCSHYAMEMGLALSDRVGARLVYVSLTDYVQHKQAPRGEMADRFYARFDALLGDYLDAGLVCAFTADHGMNDKTDATGAPDVRFLDDLLAAAGIGGHRVLLPITDPYVVHHGALGSYATVYLPPSEVEAASRALAAIPGIEAVLGRAEAADRFQLPPDRIGDLVVLGDRSTVLGKSASYHDLSAVRQGLRSHGGLHEAVVPVVVCHPIGAEHRARMERGDIGNADVFDVALNGVLA